MVFDTFTVEKYDEDDRDDTIEKLKEINDILKEKVQDLEQIVENTIGKSTN